MANENETISLANLDTAITKALGARELPGQPHIYGLIPPDWYDREEALNLAEEITKGLDNDNLEPTALSLNGQQVAIRELDGNNRVDRVKGPVIVGFRLAAAARSHK